MTAKGDYEPFESARMLSERRRNRRFDSIAWVSETGSTNEDLAAAAAAGEGEQVLITDLQTAGRGRRSRSWVAPPRTSILMSVLIIDEPIGPFWTIGAVAVAAVRGIDRVTGVSASIKWPNDLLVGEHKLAGILSQAVDRGVIVGIGINVNWPLPLAADIADSATSLNAHAGGDVERIELVAAILDELEAVLDGDVLDGDIAALRAAWMHHCDTIGRRVRVDRGAVDDLVGTVVDVGLDGSLIVENDGVRVPCHVGDVVHLRPL